MNSEYIIKKELGVYLRVPGSSDQKTDFGRFGYHPSPTGRLVFHDRPFYESFIFRGRPSRTESALNCSIFCQSVNRDSGLEHSCGILASI